MAMKYLKMYEESLGFVDLFKSKIDWKFLEYLEDRLIEYRDIGYIVSITVNVNRGNDIYEPIYVKINDDGEYKSSPNAYGHYFKYGGLYYIIRINTSLNGKYSETHNTEILQKYYNKIKSKCGVISMKDSQKIVAKPK